MRRTNRDNAAERARTRVAALAATLLLTAVEALAQEKQTGRAGLTAPDIEQSGSAGMRRIIVSIQDRKLALIVDGRVVKVYPVAVGAEVSPSPAGEFQITHRLSQPTYYAPGVVIPPGQLNPWARAGWG